MQSNKGIGISSLCNILLAKSKSQVIFTLKGVDYTEDNFRDGDHGGHFRILPTIPGDFI